MGQWGMLVAHISAKAGAAGVGTGCGGELGERAAGAARGNEHRRETGSSVGLRHVGVWGLVSGSTVRWIGIHRTSRSQHS